MWPTFFWNLGKTNNICGKIRTKQVAVWAWYVDCDRANVSLYLNDYLLFACLILGLATKAGRVGDILQYQSRARGLSSSSFTAAPGGRRLSPVSCRLPQLPRPLRHQTRTVNYKHCSGSLSVTFLKWEWPPSSVLSVSAEGHASKHGSHYCTRVTGGVHYRCRPRLFIHACFQNSTSLKFHELHKVRFNLSLIITWSFGLCNVSVWVWGIPRP